MSRAKYLFDLVKEKGEEAIDRFILERKAEELFLDFKRSANNGDSEHLDQKDIEQYERAISGFGNSEGGIVVWGVDCRKDFDGADVAKAIFPITNPRRFESNLNHLTSGRTLPPHSKVENYSFGSPGTDAGYVVTYIPQSNVAPLQTANSKNFYIRVGSSFDKAPRGVLAGLFGKRPEPVIFPMYSMGFEWNSAVEALKATIGIVITNGGASSLRGTYVNLTVYHCLGGKRLAVYLTDQDNWRGYGLFGRHFSYTAVDGYRIAPLSYVEPILLEVNLVQPFKEGTKIEMVFGCDDSPAYAFLIENNDLDELHGVFETNILPHLNHIRLGHKISRDVRASIDRAIEVIFPLPKDFTPVSDYEEVLRFRSGLP